jgi:hypothetical protein
LLLALVRLTISRTSCDGWAYALFLSFAYRDSLPQLCYRVVKTLFGKLLASGGAVILRFRVRRRTDAWFFFERFHLAAHAPSRRASNLRPENAGLLRLSPRFFLSGERVALPRVHSFPANLSYCVGERFESLRLEWYHGSELTDSYSFLFRFRNRFSNLVKTSPVYGKVKGVVDRGEGRDSKLLEVGILSGP